ncbi:MAG: hypothetical protein MJD61_22915 [Proteobacteria bacterium]|nr:hypothetical protein [Pseudomonadota bacterium]
MNRVSTIYALCFVAYSSLGAALEAIAPARAFVAERWGRTPKPADAGGTPAGAPDTRSL